MKRISLIFLWISLGYLLSLLQAQEVSTEKALTDAFLEKRPERLHYRQLLVTYRGCVNSVSERSLKEAEKRIQEIIQKIQAGNRFDLLCFQYSEHPSKNTLGVMPYFHPGEQLKEIEATLLNSPIGTPSPILGPIRTVYGLHLIQRLGPQKLYFGHILIQHQNSIPAKNRTREEALTFVQELLHQIHENQISFEALAKQHSEGPISKGRRSYLGEADVGFLPPQLEWVLLRLPFESVAQEVVETSVGFHLVKRYRNQSIRLRHILWSCSDAEKPIGNPTLDKKTARLQASEVRQKILNRQATFEEFTRKNPDDSASQGGNLGSFYRGEGFFHHYEIAELQIGEISEPLESPFGIHLLQRIE